MSFQKTLSRGFAAAASVVMSPFELSVPSAADRQFVTIALAAVDAEVTRGRTAAERASDPMVREFARTMVADHARASDQLHRLAADKGVNTAHPSEEQQHALQRLEQLTGAQFDREYVRLERCAHAQAIELFRSQAGVGGDPAIKRFAAATLPILEGHQQLADMLPVRNATA